MSDSTAKPVAMKATPIVPAAKVEEPDGVNNGNMLKSMLTSTLSLVPEKFSSPLLSLVEGQKERAELIMESKWFEEINTLYRNSKVHAVSFFHVATKLYADLAEQSSNRTVEISLFINRVKETMGNLWHDDLVGPVYQLFDRLKDKDVQAQGKEKLLATVQSSSRFDSVYTALGPVWSSEVMVAIERHLGPPAYSLYFVALEQFVAFKQQILTLTADSKLNAEQEVAAFVQRVKDALPKEEWSESLAVKVRAFYVTNKERSLTEIQKLRDLSSYFLNFNMYTFVRSQWQYFLLASSSKVDYYFPPAGSESDDDDGENVGVQKGDTPESELKSKDVEQMTIKVLQRRLTRRLRSKVQVVASKGLQDIKAYTKDYTDPLIENASNIRNQVQYERVEAKLVGSIVAVRKQLDTIVNTLTSSAQYTKAKEFMQSQDGVAKLQSWEVTVQDKLRDALTALRANGLKEQGAQSLAYIGTLPQELMKMLHMLPGLLKDEIDAERVTQLTSLANDLYDKVQKFLFWSSIAGVYTKYNAYRSGKKADGLITEEADEPFVAAKEDADDAVAITLEGVVAQEDELALAVPEAVEAEAEPEEAPSTPKKVKPVESKSPETHHSAKKAAKKRRGKKNKMQQAN